MSTREMSGNFTKRLVQMPWALKPCFLWPCCLLCRLLMQALAQRHSFGGAQADQLHRSQTRPRPRASMLCAYKDDSNCALLEFTEAPLSILRLPVVVDIGIITTSPALHKVALCITSWPAAINTQPLISDAPASHFLSADSYLTFVKISPLVRSMSLHVEILSTGQTYSYFETPCTLGKEFNEHGDHHVCPSNTCQRPHKTDQQPACIKRTHVSALMDG